MLRNDWTEAWEGPESPDPLPMPLQGLLYAPAAHRFSRVQNDALSGSPVGQIVGLMDKVRPAKDIVFDIVEEWIETTQNMSRTLDT